MQVSPKELLIEHRFQCSLHSIVKLLLPLLLASFSSNIMFIVDRAVLAHYSMDAMLSSAIAGSFSYVPMQFLMNLVGVSVVFIGRLNGANKQKEIGNIVWQMVYFSIAISICYAVFSIFYENFFCACCDALIYQKILMATAGIPGISMALSSFLIGIGKSNYVIYTVLMSNVTNIILDIILVFGNEWIQPFGLIGAAIATSIAQIIQNVTLFSIFCNKKNVITYNVNHMKLNISIIKKALDIAMPVAASNAIESFAWYKLLVILTDASEIMGMIESFSISIISFCMFFADSTMRASAAFFSNIIGARDKEAAKKTFLIFFRLNCCVWLCFALPLVINQDIVFFFANQINPNMKHIYNDLHFVLVCIWVNIFFDGICYICRGALQAGGDTKFPNYLNASTVWIAIVLPILFLKTSGQLTSIRMAYILSVIRSITVTLFVYMRYKKFNWFVGCWQK